MGSGEGPSSFGFASERRRLLEYASHEAVFDALLPAQDGVYVKDRQGRYLMVNASGAAHLGYVPDQLVGRTDPEVFPGQLGERLMRSDQEIMASGEPQTVEEPVVVGGQLRTYLSTKAPLRDSSGAVIGLVGVSTDVTALREADEEVRRREAQLAEAQALTQLGSWEWEVRTGDQRWSEEAYRIIGRDPSMPCRRSMSSWTACTRRIAGAWPMRSRRRSGRRRTVCMTSSTASSARTGKSGPAAVGGACSSISTARRCG